METVGSNEQLYRYKLLLLDNLRLCAEENYEFSPEDAADTIMVKRLAHLFDLCVLDSFPSAHRSHPSIVGFPHVLRPSVYVSLSGPVDARFIIGTSTFLLWGQEVQHWPRSDKFVSFVLNAILVLTYCS